MMDIVGYDRLPIESLYATDTKTTRMLLGPRDQCKNAMQLEHHPKSDFREVRELVHSFLKKNKASAKKEKYTIAIRRRDVEGP